jgi:CheY-like chemotaxis protein
MTSAAHTGNTTINTQPGLRILLAEDVKLNQVLTQKLLARSGFQIDVVENGLQAVTAVQDTDYDVILMDVEMPEMDGLAATKQIRAMPAPKANVVIIALTAHAMNDAEKYFKAAGMDDYVSKPINFDILFTKLSAVAER